MLNSQVGGKLVGRYETKRISNTNERPHSTPPYIGRQDKGSSYSTDSFNSLNREHQTDRDNGSIRPSNGWQLIMTVFFIFTIGLGSGWLLRGNAEAKAETTALPITVGKVKGLHVDRSNTVQQLGRAALISEAQKPSTVALDTATGARGVNLRLPGTVTKAAASVNTVQLPELPPANVGTVHDVCTVRLSGIPKSGTTWLERIIGSVAENACKTDASLAGSTEPCKFESISPRTPHGRGFVAGPFSSASKCAHIDFSIAGKHTMGNHLMSRVALAKPNKNPNFLSVGQVILDTCIEASPSVPAYSDACLSKVEATLKTTIKIATPGSLSSQGGAQDLLIGILRDPRAVALSSCRFKFSKRALKDCPSAVSDFRADTASLAMAWARAGASASHDRSVRSTIAKSSLAVFFEDMKRNPLPAYEHISGVMGLIDLLGDDGLKAVAKEASVEAMSAAEKEHDKNAHWMERSYHVDAGMGAKVREGSVDGFMEAFGDEILGEMNRTMMDLLPLELKEMYGISAESI